VDDNSFEFNLHYKLKSPLKIIGTKRNNVCHIEGMGFWWNDTVRRNVNVKWYSTDTIPNHHIDIETLMF
jgi:hypothetical protein